MPGIQEALQGFLAAKQQQIDKAKQEQQRKEDLDYRNKQMGLLARHEGLTEDPTSGDFVETPEAKEQGLLKTDLTKSIIAKNNAAANKPVGQMTPAQEEMASIRKDRLRQSIHQQTLNAIKNDPNIKSRLTQSQNLSNALDVFSNIPKPTPQDFADFQQSLIRNMGIVGQSGVDERSERLVHNAGLNWDNFKQFINSKPEQINQPEWVSHIKQIADQERKNIQNNLNKRLTTASGGHAHFYDKPENADLKEDLKSYLSNFGDEIGGGTPQAQQGLIPQQPAGMLKQSPTPSMDEIQAEIRRRGLAH